MKQFEHGRALDAVFLSEWPGALMHVGALGLQLELLEAFPIPPTQPALSEGKSR
jgi:hypothetical protein